MQTCKFIPYDPPPCFYSPWQNFIPRQKSILTILRNLGLRWVKIWILGLQLVITVSLLTIKHLLMDNQTFTWPIKDRSAPLVDIYTGAFPSACTLSNRGSIPGRVIPKTQKMAPDTSLFSTQCYKVRINDKWSNPRKGVAPFPASRCSSCWKGSLRVPLDNTSPTYYALYKSTIYAEWVMNGYVMKKN